MSLFNLEKEMAPVTIKWLKNSGLYVKEEFRTPEGVCDIVAYKFKSRAINKRLERGLVGNMTSELQISIWAYVVSFADSGCRRERLLDFFSKGFDRLDVLTSLEKLIKKGFVETDLQGFLFAENSWFPLTDKIVSIELKLKNVNEALSQAKRYSYFSDYSYIGMPLDFSESFVFEKKKMVFEESGIGLLGVDKNTVKVLIPAVKSKRPDRASRLAAIRASEIFWKDSVSIL